MSVYYFLGSLNESEKKGFVLQTITVLFFLGALFSGSLFFFSGFIATKFNNSELNHLFKIFSLYPLFTLPIFCSEMVLIAFDLPKKAAWITILIRGTMVISSILPVVLGYDLKVVFGTLVVLSFFQLFYVIYETWKPVRKFSFTWHYKILVSQVKYSVPLGISYIFQMLMLQIDKIMVSVFFVSGVFAVYANGAFEIPFVGIIAGSVINVLMPEFVKQYKNAQNESLMDLWHNSMKKVAMIIFPLAMILFVYREPFIVTLFSEKYLNSVVIFAIYLSFIPTRITDFGAILLSMGFSKIVMKIYVLAAILNILLNYVSIKTLGIIGPALSTVLVSYLVATSFIVQIKKKINVGLSEVFPWLSLVNVIAITALSGLISYPISLLNAPPILILVLGAGCYFITYIVLLKIFGIIEEADILLLKRWFKFLHITG
jgi:O-antigen/teichoic acid export membrane protein